jgi:cation transport protein ChaC
MDLSEFKRRLPGGDLWVFGYASLMWSPGFRFREKVRARLHGLHRSLCLYSHRHRGTPARPGLVMGLCAGGSCWGIAYRVSGARANAVLDYLWAREMRGRAYRVRLVRVRVAGRRAVQALAFAADPAHPQFAGDLDVEHMARMVAQGRGKRGHNVDYLRHTLAHMQEIGVRDPHLERVLQRVRALHRRSRGGRQR